MDVDTAASAVQGPAKHSIPELEIYCYLLVLIFLIDQKRYNEVILLHRNSLHFVAEIEMLNFLIILYLLCTRLKHVLLLVLLA